MSRVAIVGAIVGLLVLGVVAFAVYASYATLGRIEVEEAAPPPGPPPGHAEGSAAHRGFLYGRVTTTDGVEHEGRLRFGGTEEAFWNDYFLGSWEENGWASHVAEEDLSVTRSVKMFGVEVGQREEDRDLQRLFQARFGDIARIEARRRVILVTLKSGTVVRLDRYAVDDLADGLRVWDGGGNTVDLTENRIRTIDFFETPELDDAPRRLHGTVRTSTGEFTGYIQWNLEKGLASDEIRGLTAKGEVRLALGEVRSIACSLGRPCVVTLDDGKQHELHGTRDFERGNRGIYVDDPRYGRVRVYWIDLQRVDFSEGSDSGPGYGDYRPGSRLAGKVTTRDGRELEGLLIYDLDESETTETLDASRDMVQYSIPFGSIATIEMPDARSFDEADGDGDEDGDEERPKEAYARLTLHNGEVLDLGRNGDLGEVNLGMLVFAEAEDVPDYVNWNDVARVDFDSGAVTP